MTLVSGLSKPCYLHDSGNSDSVKLRELPWMWSLGGREKPRTLLINSDLIALKKGNEAGLEICKLEIASPAPRLQTLCILELPPMASDKSVAFYTACTEWVPTFE